MEKRGFCCFAQLRFELPFFQANNLLLKWQKLHKKKHTHKVCPPCVHANFVFTSVAILCMTSQMHCATLWRLPFCPKTLLVLEGNFLLDKGCQFLLGKFFVQLLACVFYNQIHRYPHDKVHHNKNCRENCHHLPLEWDPRIGNVASNVHNVQA